MRAKKSTSSFQLAHFILDTCLWIQVSGHYITLPQKTGTNNSTQASWQYLRNMMFAIQLVSGHCNHYIIEWKKKLGQKPLLPAGRHIRQTPIKLKRLAVQQGFWIILCVFTSLVTICLTRHLQVKVNCRRQVTISNFFTKKKWNSIFFWPYLDWARKMHSRKYKHTYFWFSNSWNSLLYYEKIYQNFYILCSMVCKA